MKTTTTNSLDSSDQDSIIDLSPEEINHLHHLANQLTVSPSQDPNLFCEKVKDLAIGNSNRNPLDCFDSLREKLVSFAKKGNENGCLLIRTLPLKQEEIPPTPPDNREKKGETTVLSKVQAILLSVLGDMIAYEAEGYGCLFQDVVPHSKFASCQTSLGSNVELEIHTEQAFSSLRPDFLSLACLRGDPHAYTYLLPVQKIIEHLTPEEKEILYQKKWFTGVDLSFRCHGKDFIEGDVRGPMSILHDFPPHLRFDQDLMKGTDEVSQRMIQKIVDLYDQHRISHCLQPGEILFIDNQRAVHGRSPFFPKYDGNDRFLIRCFATLDYVKSEYARPEGGRTVAAIYS